jgi:hypothetical protein
MTGSCMYVYDEGAQSIRGAGFFFISSAYEVGEQRERKEREYPRREHPIPGRIEKKFICQNYVFPRKTTKTPCFSIQEKVSHRKSVSSSALGTVSL